MIQSPEDTSVGKTSTFPWRNRKRSFHTLKLCRDGSIDLSVLLQNYVSITMGVGGRLSSRFCQSVKSLCDAKVNPSILSAKCSFFPLQEPFIPPAQPVLFSPRKSRTVYEHGGKNKPSQRQLTILTLFYVVAGNP